MSKIATELEAKTMGGTLSVTNNKCRTKARALELGCQVKSGYSYSNNQLVELEGIEPAARMPKLTLEVTYTNMESLIGDTVDFRGRFISDQLGKSEPFPPITVPITANEDSGLYEITLEHTVMQYMDSISHIEAIDMRNEPLWIQWEVRTEGRVSAVGQYRFRTAGFTGNFNVTKHGNYWNKANTAGTTRRYKGTEELLEYSVELNKV